MKSFLPHSHSLCRRCVREAGHSVFNLDAAVTNDQPVLRALCDHLPALRLDGHPKWREVDPALSLPIGLQRPGRLDEALTTCAPALPVSSINRRSS